MNDTVIEYREPWFGARLWRKIKAWLEPKKECNLIRHARLEFQAAGWCDSNGVFKDKMQESICKHILKLLQVFSDEGHSGTTAPYTVQTFEKLAMFEPLVPLTGEDWEWNEVAEGVLQNKRCSHVFKDAKQFNGQAYDLDAVVYWEWWADPETGEQSKSYFTNRHSRRPIVFPYTPTRTYEQYFGE